MNVTKKKIIRRVSKRHLLEKDEAAKLMYVTVRLLLILKDRGEIPFYMIGNRIMFERRDCLAWVARQRRLKDKQSPSSDCSKTA